MERVLLEVADIADAAPDMVGVDRHHGRHVGIRRGPDDEVGFASASRSRPRHHAALAHDVGVEADRPVRVDVAEDALDLGLEAREQVGASARTS